MQNSLRKQSQAGFTLLEMLVVISIIGILISMLLVNFQSSRERARDAARKADMRQIKSALRLYYNDFQQYPANDGSNRILGCGTGTGACTWGGSFEANGTQYMNYLPIDPVNNGTYVFRYAQTDSGDGFELWSALENDSDEDATKSVDRCAAAAGTNKYVVCED